LPEEAIRILNLLVGAELAVMIVNIFWAFMVFRTPAVPPSAPRIQKHRENPGDGDAAVPIMLYRFRPVPTVMVKLREEADGMVKPPKLTPGLLKNITPAPGKGPVINSDCGA
jgi:hypothetical protein